MKLSPSQQKVVERLKKGERLILAKSRTIVPTRCYWLDSPDPENPIRSFRALENKGILTLKKYSATEFEIILKKMRSK